MKQGRIYFLGQIVRAFGGMIGCRALMRAGLRISDAALLRGYCE